MSRERKKVVYRYNGEADSDEVVQDLDGEITIPEKGATIRRMERDWKVVHVTTELSVSNPKLLPVHYVFLSDK